MASSAAVSLFSSLRQETTDTNLHIFLKEFLSQYDPQTQLDLLIDMFDDALDQETHMYEAVVTAWSYLESTKIYHPQYATLEQFKEAI
jgi:hypothetical protein